MEVAPFFVDFHHFLSIFTIFYRFSRFTHFCRDLHFVAIYALFPQFFFGQNSLLRNITRFLHVCAKDDSSVFGFHNCFEEIRRGNLIRLLTRPSKNRAAQTQLFLELSAVPNAQSRSRSYSSQAKRYSTPLSFQRVEFVLEN